MKIITDKKWKNFRYRNEVPDNILKNQFDWLDEDEATDGFLKYLGFWYHLSEFTYLSHWRVAPDWHGVKNETAFSGVVITVSGNGEQYKIGRYFT